MPIIDVELVGDDAAETGLAALLADVIGTALGAPVGSTWVRLRMLPRQHYGESGPLDAEIRPVFVTILMYARPDADQLGEVVTSVTTAVADATGRPPENVHLIFAPDGAGRVSFGGRLAT